MKAGSDPRGGAAEPWGDRLTFGALCGVLLAWVIAGVHEAAVMEIPPLPGKKVGLGQLPSAASVAFGVGCVSVGLVCGCLPRAARFVVEAAIIGAFLGYVGAMVASRLRYGFSPDLVVDWHRFLSGIHDSQWITVPLGAVVGAWGGLAYWRFRRNGRAVGRGDAADPPAAGR